MGTASQYNGLPNHSAEERPLKVQGRFFALYRERIGARTLDFELDEDASAGDLVTLVTRQYPNLSPDPPSIVVAVNREYVKHGHPLKDGDEVAFIPPVSGGSA